MLTRFRWRSFARLADERSKPRGLKEAIENLEREGRPGTSAIGDLLRKCGASKSIQEGKRLHAIATKLGCSGNTFVGNLIVQMYGKCGRLDEARAAFDAIRRKNSFSYNIMIAALAHNGRIAEAREMFDGCTVKDHITWNTMVGAYAQNGHSKEAFLCFRMMDLSGIQANEFSFVAVIEACDSMAKTRILRTLVDDAGLSKHVKVGSCLVGVYGKLGRLHEAKQIFDAIDDGDVVLGTKMFLAYAQNGQMQEARMFFENMPIKDAVAWTAIVVAYAQRGRWGESKEMFDRMPDRDFIAWNSMIAAFAQNGNCKGAIKLFFCMDQDGMNPNGITLLSVLDSCTILQDSASGKRIHESIVDPEIVCHLPVKNALLNMYGRCGIVESAKSIFDTIDDPDPISWTCMITAYAQAGDLNQAKRLLDQMPGFNLMAWDTMVVAYSQAGHLQAAKSMIDTMEQPHGVGWTALVTAYSVAGCGDEALRMFRQGDLEGMPTDVVSLVSIIDACTSSSYLAHGKLMHAEAVDRGLQRDVVLGTALVTMYGRCGQPGLARSVFNGILYKNDVTWNAMITAYSQNGRLEALEIFPAMNLEGWEPTNVGFLGIFSVCAHGGLLQRGLAYFWSMQFDYGQSPLLDQFVCMIDLLGRAGRLEYAEELVRDMPFEAHSIAWMALLGSCKQQGDAIRGERAADKILKLDSASSATYVLLECLK